jgi:hypothetical protein
MLPVRAWISKRAGRASHALFQKTASHLPEMGLTSGCAATIWPTSRCSFPIHTQSKIPHTGILIHYLGYRIVDFSDIGALK